MGQRLVVSVYQNHSSERAAAIYFHWSAYTSSALMVAKDIIDYLEDDENMAEAHNDLRLACIRFVESNGGGLESDDREYIQNLYPDEEFRIDGYSRNDGLIALSEDKMAVLDYWSEGDLAIYVDEMELHNDVVFCYDSIAEFNDECEQEMAESDVFESDDFNLIDMHRVDIDGALNVINKAGFPFLWKYNDSYYSIIA